MQTRYNDQNPCSDILHSTIATSSACEFEQNNEGGKIWFVFGIGQAFFFTFW